MEALNALDLFAGPGGWDEGLLELGIRPLGVEWDDAACQTRGAAGHHTVQADVSELSPRDVYVGDGPLDLLIGSPPCPTFSAAGGGSGHQVVDVILECLDALRDGRDERGLAREEAYEALLPGAIEDERASAKKKNRPFSLERAQEKARRNATMSILVVEPFRYALELRPRWIALEQVPPVLPIWQRLAADLRAHGWNVWTGLLSSEQYGSVSTCPTHESNAAPGADGLFGLTSLATADPAATRWAEWLESAETAARRSTFLAAQTSVHRAATGSVITATETEALSAAWNVAALARAARDAASDATWQERVDSLRSQALPAQQIQPGGVAAIWGSTATRASESEVGTGQSIASWPSVFWAALCSEARSYTTSTRTEPTTLRKTSGSSSPTPPTCGTTGAETSRAECSLCDSWATPQTRERAIVLADLDRPVRAPDPTHQRYVPPRKEPDLDRLFEPGRRERIVVRGEEHLEPWVSMAQALGWVADERPSRTLCGHHTPRWLYGEQDPREGISVLTRGEDGSRPNDVYDATERPSRAVTGRAYSLLVDGVEDGQGLFVQRERSGDRAEEGFDPDEAPSQALTSKARSWSVRTSYGEPHRGPEAGSPTPEFDPEERPSRTVVGKAASWELLDERSPEFNRGPVDPEEQPAPTVSSTSRQWSVRTGDNSRAAGGETVPFERDLDAPAPTLTAKVADAWTVDRPSPTIVGGRRSKDGMLAGRQLPPGEGENVGGWGYERPATVVAGDRRLHPPGHKENAQDPPGTFEQRRGENAVRLSVAEASILQGFRPDYPWQGSRTKQFEQVGNAVPPPLARACVKALLA